MTLKVFISYAKEDQEHALNYFNKLISEGVSPWMDVMKILPGQRWEFEIDKALKEANVVVLLVSPRSVDKRGFVQREVNDAIEQLRYKKKDDIYILPLVLEECEVPVFVSRELQYIDMNLPGAWERVQKALMLAAEQQQIELQRGSVTGLFRIFSEKIFDKQAGAPGYDVVIEYPRFVPVQESVAGQADELSMLFAGRAVQALIGSREKPWEQNQELFPNADEFPPINYLQESFGIAHATEKFLSITYSVTYFPAGAAHGSSGFETFNFSLDEGVRQLSLHDFFENSDEALKIISKVCVEKLCKEFWERLGERPDQDQVNWFNEGAGPDWDNFQAFNVHEDCFTFLFAPYQVGCYALGTWSVSVDFYDLRDCLRASGPHSFAKPQQAS